MRALAAFLVLATVAALASAASAAPPRLTVERGRGRGDRRRGRPPGPAARPQRQPARRLLPGRPGAADDDPAHRGRLRRHRRARLQRRPPRHELVGLPARARRVRRRPYVARVREAVRWAAEHDLYVVLDMHQDAWGKHIATPPGTSLPARARPRGRLGRRAAVGDAHRRHDDLPRRRHARAVAGGRAGVPVLLRRPRGHPERARRDVGPHRRARSPASRTSSATTCSTSRTPASPSGRTRASCSAASTRGRSRRSAPARGRRASAPRIVLFEPSVLWSGFGDRRASRRRASRRPADRLRPAPVLRVDQRRRRRDARSRRLRQRRARRRPLRRAAVVG